MESPVCFWIGGVWRAQSQSPSVQKVTPASLRHQCLYPILSHFSYPIMIPQSGCRTWLHVGDSANVMNLQARPDPAWTPFTGRETSGEGRHHAECPRRGVLGEDEAGVCLGEGSSGSHPGSLQSAGRQPLLIQTCATMSRREGQGWREAVL